MNWLVVVLSVERCTEIQQEDRMRKQEKVLDLAGGKRDGEKSKCIKETKGGRMGEEEEEEGGVWSGND